MTNRIKTIAATVAAFTLAGTAIAQDQVTLSFSIDPDAGVEANYETIRETAAQACNEIHPERTTPSMLSHRRVKKKCRVELIEAAVSAFADPYLTALHKDGKIGFLTFASKD
ncbi:MAG: hypothetical protein AAGL97_09480 [Pseudomonadota bacterium]